MIDAILDHLPHTAGGCIAVILVGLVLAVIACVYLENRPGTPTGPEMVRRAGQIVDDVRRERERDR